MAVMIELYTRVVAILVCAITSMPTIFTFIPYMKTVSTPTLLSPPEMARMSPVMDQLACHTTSLNVFNTYRRDSDTV